MDRIDKKKYYLNIAREVSKRSTCLRRQYGAVIVKHDEIIATGYNGAPRGQDNCCDVGECYRERNNIPHGEQYEKCVAVHAEQNAIISAARRDMIGATMYLAGYDAVTDEELDAEPCLICRRMIANAGIDEVITLKDFVEKKEEPKYDQNGLLKCKKCGVFPEVHTFVEYDFSKKVVIQCPVCKAEVRGSIGLSTIYSKVFADGEALISEWNNFNT